MQRMQDRTLLITGAGKGIGREMALLFASEGALVVSLDLDKEGNAETASMIRTRGGRCEPLDGDASVEGDVLRAFRQAQGVDILINNAAAWADDGFLHELSVEGWDRVQAATLKSAFLCSREAVREMGQRRSGCIVSISSVNALSGLHLAAYSAAKGGVLALTRVIVQQYGHFGIRANAICPGTILSEASKVMHQENPELGADLRSLYPAGEFGEPLDVAHCALFLASEEAKFINGSTIVVDGGATAVHRLASAKASLP